MWFDPSLAVTYTPRGSWKALAKQYYEYGWWKGRVLRLHPGSARARQLIPPFGLFCVVLGIAVGVRRPSALGLPAAYALSISSTARSSQHPLITSGVLVTLHTAWTLGFLRSLFGEWSRSHSHPSR